MNLTQCANGHYYDGDKFSSCPHCKGGAASSSEESVTISYDSTTNPTVDTAAGASSPTIKEVTSNQNTANTNASVKLSTAPTAPMVQPLDDATPKTVRLYETEMEIEPVVGWLVALSGKAKGKSYMLKAGPNFIGRDLSMNVSITEDNTVSRNKHAVVIYDPKSRRFFALPGESRALFYVDDEVVLNNVEVKDRQLLTVGETKLMLVAFCNEKFAWEDLKEDKDE